MNIDKSLMRGLSSCENSSSCCSLELGFSLTISHTAAQQAASGSCKMRSPDPQVQVLMLLLPMEISSAAELVYICLHMCSTCTGADNLTGLGRCQKTVQTHKYIWNAVCWL